MDKALKGRIDARRHAYRLNALFEDTEALEGYYARFHQTDFQARLLPLLTLGIIATQSWMAALILLMTLIPFVAMMALLGMGSAAESRRQMDALSRLSNLLLDRIKALPLILVFDDGRRQTRTIGHAASDVAERTLRVLKIAFVTSAVLEFFSALSVALIAVYCGFYLLGELPFRSPEPLTLATAFFVLALSPEVYAPMRRLAAAYHDQQTATAAAQRLMALQPDPEAIPVPALDGPPEIAYRNVIVTFPDDPDFRIGPVSFTCAPGSVTCLAGASGSGKTSLLRLLIDPTCAGIAVDGTALRAGQDLSSQIAYASQVPPILAGSLRDNLRLANTAATEDEILSAAETAGLMPLVQSRPQGLDTLLDDRGSGLSGGERRRIGLARGALKPAPILLLDEPTADLDPASEDDILARLPALFAGRTVLFTSHSPRLQALADQVIAL
jgi:ATP-binding cassette, subfamily C, bacterial CydD